MEVGEQCNYEYVGQVKGSMGGFLKLEVMRYRVVL